MAKHNDLGRVGERVARQFLSLHGFVITGHNIRLGKKEIDILAEKRNVLHVVEVKAVGKGSLIHPSDNMTQEKKKNLRDATLLLLEKDEFHGKRVQIDFLAITLDEEAREAECILIENIDT